MTAGPPFTPEWGPSTREDAAAPGPHDDYVREASDAPRPPREQTAEQASRERRRFWHLIDPWAPVPSWYVDERCVGCGGRNGHAGTCPYFLNPNLEHTP